MGESPPAGAAPAEITDYAVFEGMFRRALRVEPDGPLANALRDIGFDLRSPKGRYPSEIWRASLDVAARHQFPGRSLEEGHRELGRLFTAGFFETIIGKVIGSIIPFLGTERMMARMPKFASMTTSGLVMDVVREGEKRYRLRCHSRQASADFTAGAMEASVEKTKVPVEVQIERRSPEGFEIVLTELG